MKIKNLNHKTFLLGLALAVVSIFVSFIVSELLLPWLDVSNERIFRVISNTTFVVSSFIAIAIIFLVLYIIYNILHFNNKVSTDDYLEVSIKFLKFSIGFEVSRLVFSLLAIFFLVDVLDIDIILESLAYFNLLYFILSPILLGMYILEKTENLDKLYVFSMTSTPFILLLLKFSMT